MSKRINPGKKRKETITNGGPTKGKEKRFYLRLETRLKEVEESMTRLKEVEAEVARLKEVEAEVVRLKEVEAELENLKEDKLHKSQSMEIDEQTIRLDQSSDGEEHEVQFENSDLELDIDSFKMPPRSSNSEDVVDRRREVTRIFASESNHHASSESERRNHDHGNTSSHDRSRIDPVTEKAQRFNLKANLPRDPVFRTFGEKVGLSDKERLDFVDFAREFGSWISARGFAETEDEKIQYLGRYLRGDLASDFNTLLEELDEMEGKELTLDQFALKLEDRYFGIQTTSDRRKVMRDVTWNGEASLGLAYLRDKTRALDRCNIALSEKCDELVDGIRERLIHRLMAGKVQDIQAIGILDNEDVVWMKVKEALRQEVQHNLRIEKEGLNEKKSKSIAVVHTEEKKEFNKNVTCYHCGKVGHPISVCRSRLNGQPAVKALPSRFDNRRLDTPWPKAQGKQQQQQSQKPILKRAREDQRCFRCQGFGHFAKDCKDTPVWETKESEKEKRVKFSNSP
jgi:hypothetical protein